MATTTTTTLTDNMIEALRREASEHGDCDTSQICNEALWGAGRKRAAARRKVVAMINAAAAMES